MEFSTPLPSGGTPSLNSRIIGNSIPKTETRAAIVSDEHLSATDITSHFKGRDVFTFDETDKFDKGKLFLTRFALIIKNTKIHSLKAFLSSSSRIPREFPPVDDEAEPVDSIKIVDQHNSAIFTALVLLTDGTAVKTVQRYEDDEDGIAAYRALHRSVYKDNVQTHLSTLKKKLSNFSLSETADPTKPLDVYTETQRAIARVTAYDEYNQLADLLNLLPERYASLRERSYNDVDHFVSTVVNYWDCFVKGKNSRPAKASAAGITDGSGGGRNRLRGGRGGGRSGIAGRGGGGGRSSGHHNGQNHSNQNGSGNATSTTGASGACFLCGSATHQVRKCPHRGAAIHAAQTAAAVSADPFSAAAVSVSSTASTSSSAPRPTEHLQFLQPKPAGAGAVVDFASFGDFVAGFMVFEPTSFFTSTAGTIVAFGIAMLFFGIVSVVFGTLTIIITHYAFGVHSASVAGVTDGLKAFHVDSCATVHVCRNLNWFTSIDYSQTPTANAVSNEPTTAAGVGVVRFCPTDTEGRVTPIVLTNVWYLPDQPFNLLSVSAGERVGMQFPLDKRQVRFHGHVYDHEARRGVYPWRETSSIAAVTPKISRDRADWQLFKSIFQDLFSKFSEAEPAAQWWELFRKAGNELCAQGYDVQNSAFPHEWVGRDFYGNPVFEEQFIYRTLDKALTDFSKSPTDTRFLFLVPDWPTSSWYGFVKHFQIIRRFEKGTVMFSAPGVGTYDHSRLTPAGDEGGPGRFIIDGIPFPVLALYLDANTVTKIDDSLLLHLRLGHPGERTTEFLARNYEHGLSPAKAAHSCKHCPVCKLAKGTRKAAYPSNNSYDQYSLFGLVFSDIFGPVNPTSHGGSRYLVHFMCATSRFPFVYVMDSRADAAVPFTRFITSVHQLGHKIGNIVLRTDGDTAYLGNLQAVCENQGIRQETTAPYVHTNAAVAERFWRTLLDITRSLLALSQLEHKYWPLAVYHATYLYVRRPHGSLEFQSPYEQLFHVKPCLTHLRVFGSDAFYHVEETLRSGMQLSKLHPKTVRGIYVGHDEHSATTLVFNPESQKVVRRGHVTVVENVADDGRVQRMLNGSIPPLLHTEDNPELLSLPNGFDDTESVPVFSSIKSHSVYFDGGHETLGLVRVVTPQSPGGVWVYAHALLHQDSQRNAPLKLRAYLQQHRRTSPVNVFHPIFSEVQIKLKGRNAHLKEPEPAFIVSHDTKSKTGYQVGYINDRDQGCQDVQNGQAIFPEITAAISDSRSYATYKEPQSYQHSKSYPDAQEWEDATQRELQSFVELGVIKPCDKEDIPSDKYVVDSRMVYKLKLNKDGSIDKYKARLVCRGFTQVYGENYEETFAPVSQLVTVRVVIALCLHFRMTPRHLDVKTAFLNSTLTHEVYVKLPPGVTINGKSYGLAIKSIYGLKQAAHDWHKLQEEFILSFDPRIRKSKVDPCLYVIVDGDLVVLISTHVDDYVVAATQDAWYQSFVTAFKKRFDVNDLGILDHLLQMSIEWQPFNKGVSISQQRYIRETAEKYGLLDCKPMQTPMDKNLHLESAAVCDTSLPYRNLIGALLWIARASRPDILFAVIYLSKFATCHDEQHFKVAKRILRYLITTVDKKLTFHRQAQAKDLSVKVYTDSDWAGDSSDRKSFSGSVVFLNGCTVSWYCKKQSTVALSSVEAEYMALSDATRETLYARNLLTEFFTVTEPIPLNMDNKGAGHIAENDINNKLTKHIDIRHHFVRQYIQQKVIELFYVPTTDNVSDIFTKALGPDVFTRLASMLLRIPCKSNG